MPTAWNGEANEFWSAIAKVRAGTDVEGDNAVLVGVIQLVLQAALLRELVEHYAAEVRCRDCGNPVEFERRVYVVPTCYACLPPPPPLPVLTELPGGKR